jgi:hypothetical protein
MQTKYFLVYFVFLVLWINFMQRITINKFIIISISDDIWGNTPPPPGSANDVKLICKAKFSMSFWNATFVIKKYQY